MPRCLDFISGILVTGKRKVANFTTGERFQVQWAGNFGYLTMTNLSRGSESFIINVVPKSIWYVIGIASSSLHGSQGENKASWY